LSEKQRNAAMALILSRNPGAFDTKFRATTLRATTTATTTTISAVSVPLTPSMTIPNINHQKRAVRALWKTQPHKYLPPAPCASSLAPSITFGHDKPPVDVTSQAISVNDDSALSASHTLLAKSQDKVEHSVPDASFENRNANQQIIPASSFAAHVADGVHPAVAATAFSGQLDDNGKILYHRVGCKCRRSACMKKVRYPIVLFRFRMLR
jgi:hypothetical protein